MVTVTLHSSHYGDNNYPHTLCIWLYRHTTYAAAESRVCLISCMLIRPPLSLLYNPLALGPYPIELIIIHFE